MSQSKVSALSTPSAVALPRGVALGLVAIVAAALAMSISPSLVRLADVGRLTASIAKVRPFIAASDWTPTALTERADLKARIVPAAKQMELFAA